eukprot:Cvel_31300.t1-p1 / transcript=Cvel_31300.t1 / gene=Cvel_31300 / organism=Chromera_velia_CCMP2878 / gene_product=Meckelin, putative / transcript_product=Meckelin, putative / location=Cvel_scaffold4640:52-7843(-) / protein_length=894 / sequence_SO=supercontig / SO=protein_coding / is_pseudo=false
MILFCIGAAKASLFFLLLLFPLHRTQTDFQTVSSCTDATGTGNAFLDTTDFQCKECTIFSSYGVPTDDGTDCTCDRRTVIGTSSAGYLDCIFCGDGSAPSIDQTRCIPCGANTTYNSDLAECTCAANEVTIERNRDGSWLSEKYCLACATPSLNFRGPQQPSRVYECDPCPARQQSRGDGTCECASGYVTAGDSCVSDADFSTVDESYPVATAPSVSFGDSGAGTSGFTVSSDTISYLYLESAVGCGVYHNLTMCQTLANLCVMNVYDTSSVCCSFYESTGTKWATSQSSALSNPSTNTHDVDAPADSLRFRGYPWLIFGRSSQELLEDETWQTDLSLDTGNANNLLRFWLARFGVEGEFLGWQRVNSELNLCANPDGKRMNSTTTAEWEPTWARYGFNFQENCEIHVSALLECGNPLVFFEMFVENSDSTLVPVMVRISNLIRFGELVNAEGTDISKHVFVRRFMVCDAVTGRTGTDAYIDGADPVAIRYASYIGLSVIQRNGSTAESAFTPILNITYSSLELTAGDLTSGERRVSISFQAEYVSIDDGFVTILTALVSICAVFCAFCVLWMFIFFKRRNPTDYNSSLMAGANGVLPLISLTIVARAMGIFVNCFFWFIFAVCFFYFLFFKAQDGAYLFLPGGTAGATIYKVLEDWLIALTVIASVSAGVNLYEQSQYFVFLIDREPVNERVKGMEADREGRGYRRTPSPSPDRGRRKRGADRTAHARDSDGDGGDPDAGVSSSPAAPSRMPPVHAQGKALHNPVRNDVGGTQSTVWRSLLLLNEFNERQTYTSTNLEITWIAIILLMEGGNWKNAARWVPGTSLDTLDEETAPYNPILQIALTVSVWLFVVISQLIVFRAFAIFTPRRLDTLLDLCSLTNISFVIMNEPGHG